MELNDLQQTRLAKLDHLRDAGMEPFPPRDERTHTVQQVLDNFEDLGATREPLKLAGRLMLRRVMGGSSFAHLEDESGRIQIFLSKKDGGAEAYGLFDEQTDIGDIC